jgi:hypothetical protein
MTPEQRLQEQLVIMQNHSACLRSEMSQALANAAEKLSVLERLVCLARSATGRPALLAALATMIVARNQRSRWMINYAAIAVPLWPALRAFWQSCFSATVKTRRV